MTHKINFLSASSESIIRELCLRLEAIRLSQNISQADLAEEAGVSRSTLVRIARGKPVSLDSFVRVMQALKLSDHLAAMLPEPSIRPVDRVRHEGSERRRASRKRSTSSNWAWKNKAADP